MTRSPVTFEGQLCRAWNAGKPTRAQSYVPPFYDALDFDSYRLMGRARTARAFVTYPDHYALLAAILGEVRAGCGPEIDEILINSRMPSVVRLPADFFGTNVLFLNDPEDEAVRLAKTGVQVLVIRERFVRHTVEAADNGLSLLWWNAPEDGTEAMQRLATRLRGLGIAPAAKAAA
ncbi:hypothetical protein GGQ68_001020 [Sagittula marina]|uniref:Uncharacterized protein n=1 Tax=Sagittula marina TaxID=943940 RepID=A0A7W6DT22_9RHOB|nr:hypothetical protein [Sagittula marina]MBB3984704.1 hypothetical protein [Sagittula marina]